MTSPTTQALKTDLYQLTMAAAYFHGPLRGTRVTCEAFLRRLPPRRGFLVMTSVERIAGYLAGLHFSDDDLDFLHEIPSLRPALSEEFVAYLHDFRFRGDVWAAPEGSLVFANQPIVRVTGDIIEAQIVETYLLSILNHGIKVGSKAARVVLAAAGAPVVEFGSRRTHDEAAVDAARAAYVAGCAGTANVEAGRRAGVPVVGTAAHMFIMAHARPGLSSSESERLAFAAFADLYPSQAVLLVDTYDSERGVDNAIAAAGQRLGGIQLDSGDLLALARMARAKLDAAGLTSAKIIASSGLDEHAIAQLVAERAPIDSYGVGENITEPVDAPITGVVYKLVQNHTANLGVCKRSSGGKSTRPGVKQVWRLPDHDLVTLAGETGPPGSEPLLVPLMTAGRPHPLPPASSSREHCLSAIDKLPERLRQIPTDPHAADPESWPVEFSAQLEAETTRALHDTRE